MSAHYPELDGVATMGAILGRADLLALVAARYAEEDARVSAALDHILATAGRCRYCGEALTDGRMRKTPGLCWKWRCRKRAAREGRES